MYTTIEGKIKNTFFHGDYCVGIIYDGKNFTDIITKEKLNVGDVIKVTGELRLKEEKMVLEAEKIEKLESEEKDAVEKKIEERITVGMQDFKMLVEDEITKEIKGDVIALGKKLLIASRTGKFVILRYHRDADGIAGALALSTIFERITSFKQSSAVYGPSDAIKDLGVFRDKYQPLLILLDFGSGPESIQNIRLVKTENVEVVSVDHHPIDEKLVDTVDFVLNPWKRSKKGICSNYPSGYLCAEVARSLWTASEEYLKELARISLCGDKSNILPMSEEDEKKALVFDYVSCYAPPNSELEFYQSLMTNKELYLSFLVQTNEKVEQIKKLIENEMKKKELKDVYVGFVNLDRIITQKEFPSSGKATTIAYEVMKEKHDACVVVGYVSGNISFRVSNEAYKKGVNALRIIEEVKKELKEVIESGGGHEKAANMKYRKGFGKVVLREILKILEEKR